MIKLSFKVNGRTVPSNRIAEELMKNVKKAAVEQGRKHIQSIRCPVHHQTARLVPTGSQGQFRVEGCCDRLIAAVQQNLK